MPNITPLGIDETTGQQRKLTTSDVLTSEGSSALGALTAADVRPQNLNAGRLTFFDGTSLVDHASATIASGVVNFAGAGVDSLTVGTGSTASAQGCTAYGVGATCGTVTFGTALGRSSTCTGGGLVAGYLATDGGYADCVVLGNSASSTQQQTVVIGTGSTAGGTYTGGVAIGYGVTLGGGGRSVAVGLSVTCNAQEAVAHGPYATVTADYGVALGRAANATQAGCTSLGADTDATASSCTACGTGAQATTSSWGSAFGYGASVTGGNLVLGANASDGGFLSIVVGRGSASTANNQLVIGGSVSVTHAFVGRGVTSATPDASLILQSTRATTTETDTAGTSLVIASGEGTGAATGSTITIRTPTPTGTGTAQQTLGTRLKLSNSLVAAYESLALPSDQQLLFSSTTDPEGSADAGLARDSAGVFKATDGASALGAIRVRDHSGSSLSGIFFGATTHLRRENSGFLEVRDSTGLGAAKALTFEGKHFQSEAASWAASDDSPEGLHLDAAAAISWNPASTWTSAKDAGLKRLAVATIQSFHPTNGYGVNFRQSEEVLSALSGTSATTSGLIPAGVWLLGVSVRVTTAITGATSFDVGDGSDVDRFAAGVAVALGSTADMSDSTADPTGFATGAREVTLTAVGSDFTAGAVRVVAHYLDVTAPTA